MDQESEHIREVEYTTWQTAWPNVPATCGTSCLEVINGATQATLKCVLFIWSVGQPVWYFSQCLTDWTNHNLFLSWHHTTHMQEILLEFHYEEIVSTRKLRSQAGQQYVDIKHGNLMQQDVLRCETPYVSPDSK